MYITNCYFKINNYLRHLNLSFFAVYYKKLPKRKILNEINTLVKIYLSLFILFKI